MPLIDTEPRGRDPFYTTLQKAAQVFIDQLCPNKNDISVFPTDSNEIDANDGVSEITLKVLSAMKGGTVGGVVGGATQQDVDNSINALRIELIGGAGAALDTFGELSAAINEDATFASTVAMTLSTKANSVDIGYTDRDFTLDYTTARDN